MKEQFCSGVEPSFCCSTTPLTIKGYQKSYSENSFDGGSFPVC